MTTKTKAIWINSELHKKLKMEALEKDITLQELVESYFVKHTKNDLNTTLKGLQTKIGDILND